MKTPRSDLIVSFITVFGLVALILDGTTPMSPRRVVLVAAGAALVGSLVLRAWMCRACDPQRGLRCCGAEATVVKAIPAGGFGQVEVDVGGCKVKLAARTINGESIPAGAQVEIVSRQESVVIVEVKA
jgi:membrane protein implicated in regulation of membrane protease activity